MQCYAFVAHRSMPQTVPSTRCWGPAAEDAAASASAEDSPPQGLAFPAAAGGAPPAAVPAAAAPAPAAPAVAQASRRPAGAPWVCCLQQYGACLRQHDCLAIIDKASSDSVCLPAAGFASGSGSMGACKHEIRHGLAAAQASGHPAGAPPACCLQTALPPTQAASGRMQVEQGSCPCACGSNRTGALVGVDSFKGHQGVWLCWHYTLRGLPCWPCHTSMLDTRSAARHFP